MTMRTRNAPSLARLESAFPGKGSELRKLLKGETKTSEYQSVKDLIRACYNHPEYSYRLMTALDEIVEGYGIETLFKGQKAIAEYVNMGETYAVTIIRKIDTGSIIISCWGDFAESNRL